jgi:hypothetical protein
MRPAVLAALAALSACCSRTPSPAPAVPSPQAIAAELATYKQVLVPLAPDTKASVQRAIRLKGADKVVEGDYQEFYEKGEAVVDGSTATVLVAYSGAWLLPKGTIARPMTAAQFLRAFAADESCVRAVLATPRGAIVVARDQTVDVLVEIKTAGGDVGNIPFTVVSSPP